MREDVIDEIEVSGPTGTVAERQLNIDQRVLGKAQMIFRRGQRQLSLDITLDKVVDHLGVGGGVADQTSIATEVITFDQISAVATPLNPERPPPKQPGSFENPFDG
jgi:hypothetical protein